MFQPQPAVGTKVGLGCGYDDANIVEPILAGDQGAAGFETQIALFGIEPLPLCKTDVTQAEGLGITACQSERLF